jgi:tRNA-splicing ligase RtcB
MIKNIILVMMGFGGKRVNNMAISELEAKLGRLVPIKLWTPLHEVESTALDQLKNIASLPQVFHHVAVMADCHFGKGATVGSVIALKDAISPAAVGVDIGCGMAAVKTSLKASDLPDDLKDIRHQIERDIPTGFSEHQDYLKFIAKLPLWNEFTNLHPEVQDRMKKAYCQIGTLGGGNHFIEICLDTTHNVWLMLHSGSRNIGKTLAGIHMNIAKDLGHNATLKDKDLATFLSGTPEMAAYRHDLMWAQEYAFENRRAMLKLFKDALRRFFPEIAFGEEILCHHNYVSDEIHFGERVLVTRKGAINAEAGRLGIIPGSMGAKSFIVKGLGNPESFNSASHGAGRRMSRGAAKRTFTVDDLKKQTEGVECKKDSTVLDEIPGAYKDIEVVMSYQADLVEIVAELKQVLCVKG